MVRTGVVQLPSDWDTCGYREIQMPPRRYGVIDQAALLDVFGFKTKEQLRLACRDWVEEVLQTKCFKRDSAWSKSLAVGRPEFVEDVKNMLSGKAQHREVIEKESLHVLREPPVTYTHYFTPQKYNPGDMSMGIID